MLKKIFTTCLIVLQLLTQSAFAFEFQPIRFIQPLPITSDILKNKTPARSESAFLFFKISDNFVNHPLAVGQGMSFSSGESADKKLSNPAGWRLTDAYLHAPLRARIHAAWQELRKPLVGQYSFASKSLTRFWQSRLLLGVHSGSFPGNNVAALMKRNMLFTVTDDNASVTRYDYDTNGKLF